MHNAHSGVKAKRTLLLCKMHSMKIDDRPDEAKRLEQARIARGFPTAKAAAEYFGWKYSAYAQHENGQRGLSRAAKKYAKSLRTTAAWLQHGVGDGPAIGVPLKGYVGAGGAVEALPFGSDETVDAPAERVPDAVAARVRGNSMYPLFRDGWLIYWSRIEPPRASPNDPVVVQLEDDRIMIKNVMRGSGDALWNLVSVNPDTPTLEDQVVRWIAPIDWIKPR